MALGILAFLLILAFFGYLGDIAKWLGLPFVFIPSQLGLTNMVTPAEVMQFNLASAPTTVNFTRPGRYAVYANDYDLLVTTDLLIEAEAMPWLTIMSQETGKRINVAFISRGLMPYDTPFARGRPIMTFIIKTAGVYGMNHPAKPADIFITPDYTSENEALIRLLFLLQVGLIALVLGVLYYRRQRPKLLAHKIQQKERRESAEALWKAADERRKKIEGKEKDKPGKWDAL